MEVVVAAAGTAVSVDAASVVVAATRPQSVHIFSRFLVITYFAGTHSALGGTHISVESGWQLALPAV